MLVVIYVEQMLESSAAMLALLGARRGSSRFRQDGLLHRGGPLLLPLQSRRCRAFERSYVTMFPYIYIY